MTKPNLAAIAASALIILSCGGTDYAAFVDPTIGSGGHGHVFVGANVPFGFVQLGPASIPQGWDWCSGYHESDSTVIGFAHLHLSGTGCGDLCDIGVMPVTGEVTYARGTEEDPSSGLWSYAIRSKEVAEPGYYSVPLERYGILAELTATARCGFHRYTFPESDNAALVFDLENGVGDTKVDAGFEVVDDRTVRGWRYSHGWANKQKVFFYAEFSKPFTQEGPGGRYGRFSFHTAEGEKVFLKVGLSPVSMEGAERNLLYEIPGWNFDKVRKAARDEWNRELRRIRISSQSRDELKVFYTALYHSMIAPSVYDDTDRSYRGSDDSVRVATWQNYTTFSLWDTYRAEMPLLTIIEPERMDDMTETMYHIYREQGKLPVWHLMSCETNCMVGNPGVIAFADNIVKGFRGSLSDGEILDALTTSASLPERGQEFRLRDGFIHSDLCRQAVARNMEFDIADAAVANAAKCLGNDSIANIYTQRSLSYRNFWDPQTRFMRGRLSTDGSFVTPFIPNANKLAYNDYTEGTAWQYIWLVPQDVDGLKELFGGREAMVAKLDSLFLASSELAGDSVVPDISGLIGQYCHGNEPDHHAIYLYSMLGEPDKAADRLREVYSTMYGTGRDGLSGNEDVGQMSAWYILSSLGFYQVEPAVKRLWFGAPAFEKAVVKVAGGRFTITADGLSKTNRYIRGVTLNGKKLDRNYLEWDEITSGGTLVFTMGPKEDGK